MKPRSAALASPSATSLESAVVKPFGPNQAASGQLCARPKNSQSEGMSRVVQILTAESPASEMRPRAEARAVPGKGLEGDRYFLDAGTFSSPRQKPDFEITLIESEKIEA